MDMLTFAWSWIQRQLMSVQEKSEFYSDFGIWTVFRLIMIKLKIHKKSSCEIDIIDQS